MDNMAELIWLRTENTRLSEENTQLKKENEQLRRDHDSEVTLNNILAAELDKIKRLFSQE